jgi:hypothetical protein
MGLKLQLRIAAAQEEEQYNEQQMVESSEMLMDCRSCNSIQSLPVEGKTSPLRNINALSETLILSFA